jgi:serine/threonine-protein kinase
MSEAATPKLSTGTVLGEKFEITGVLGEGGTGVVYEAKQLTDQKIIALKVVHPALSGDKQVRGRFLREAAVLRVLGGDFICPVLESGELPQQRGAPLLYLALPKIDGRSLASVIARDGVMPLPEVTRLTSDILTALASAHARGIIHRDLKTQNVLLRDGKDVVVVDFGMAKIITGASTGTTTELTAHNMVFGTPEYMSPEQARGDEVDARCDVYACGVILYELLTGTVPFSGGTPLTVLTRHLMDEPEPLAQRAKDRKIPKALAAVAMHALGKKPADRYDSAEAMRAALVHANAAPDDVENVHPARFTSEEEPDAHARTMPAISQRVDSTKPPAVRVNVRSDAPPSRAPSSNPASGSASERAARLKKAAPAPPQSNLGKYAVWVLLAFASIGLGVWLALRQ